MLTSALAQPSTLAVAGDNPWNGIDQLPAGRPAADVWIRAQRFQASELNQAALRRLLEAAPREVTQRPHQSQAHIALPMPDGSVARFRFVESPVMAPELAAKFPEIKTYLGQGMEDPAATVRFDVTPAGFHAQILSPHGAVYIDPAFRGDNRLHTSYFKRDHRRAADGFQCLTSGGQTGAELNVAQSPDLARSGGNLRTYRLAVAATGEYTAYHGGTKSAGLAAIVTAVNRVSGVYEAELAIRLMLVANNDLVVYTSSGTDPFSNNNPSALLSQNQATLDSVIGSANYDIGHVFSTAGGGLASLGVVCVNGAKARGETGTGAPIGDAFYIDYVAHEMGHQFGANHTFNSSTSSCGGGNRNATTAYERGSGSTIMSYAGICASDDLQPHSDPYFHSTSFDELLNYSTAGTGNSCADVSSTGNRVPMVSAGPNFTIPQNTPFTLTASGSDPDGDLLTYCWEERDLGASTTVTAPDNGSSPLFRSFTPTTSPARTFPRLQNLLNNTLPLGEVMPTTTRTLNFRVTARDNRAGGGGVNSADMRVSVSGAAGPFLVTSHNSGGAFSNATTVTWKVAGTTDAPVSVANVNILLSTNGGLDFPITLLANTPNDGSQSVVLPNLTTSTARIKVEAAGNIFFDLCNANFSIVPGVPTPLVALESATLLAENCAAGNHAIDPGETVTLNFTLQNTGSLDTTNLVATLLATNGVTLPDEAKSYGALIAGGSPASRAFRLTASGACGGTMTAVLQLQDGELNLGTVSQSLSLGALTTTSTSPANTAALSIPASGTRGKASDYPSSISAVGVTGAVSKITVTLNGLNHTYPDDLDILLVGPTGQAVMLMSDCAMGNNLNNVTLTFDDTASETLPDSSPILSGDYQPTDFDAASDALPAPAPAGPFGTSLSAFNGMDPNGTWLLYINDDSNRDAGSLAQGWQLSITTATPTCCQGLANRPPALAATTNFTIVEGDTLTFTNFATDADAPPQLLTFSLLNAPTNATINAASGVFTWKTGELDGPGTNVISVSVTDDGVPALSSMQSFSVLVLESNVAPKLAAIPNRSIHSGMTLVLTNVATDSDVPPNALTFSLDAGSPATASIGASDGVLTWTPTDADAGTVQSLTIRVSDNGLPQLSHAVTFPVTIVSRPLITGIQVSGDFATLTWAALPGQTYQLQFNSNLTDADWSGVLPEVVASGTTVSQTNALVENASRFYRVMIVP